MIDSNWLLDLEIEFRQGGWRLSTQERLLNYLRGAPKRFSNLEAKRIADEAKRTPHHPV